MDRSSPPVGRSIGPALRELLDASPKAVRRAVDDRRGAEDLDGGKRAKKEETRRLVSSLDAVARFLTDFSALHPEFGGDQSTAHPVLDPLLERIVRPTAGRERRTKQQTSIRSTSSADEKKTALRLAAWLVSPAEALLGGEKENDAIRRTDDVGEELVKRCAPPTPRRTRLAACIALKHAAVNVSSPEAKQPPRAFTTAAAEALLLTIAESERARDEADPPTRLAVAAVDAALAVTARAANAAAEGDVVEFAAHANAARETCAVVRGWWRAGSPARAPAVAQTYTGVSAMSALGTRVAISSSIGPIASATSSADLPAKDARGVSSLTRAPAGSSVNADAEAPGETRKACARHPVLPASTTTTKGGRPSQSTSWRASTPPVCTYSAPVTSAARAMRPRTHAASTSALHIASRRGAW